MSSDTTERANEIHVNVSLSSSMWENIPIAFDGKPLLTFQSNFDSEQTVCLCDRMKMVGFRVSGPQYFKSSNLYYNYP